MTSLELFPPVEHTPKVPKEWGTGKLKEDVNLWIPGPPTWQYKGEPVDQFYTLTQLKLSNVRTNDELIQRPQASKMGDILINKEFPADHPYSSHMSRYAMFPNFNASEDPKRGVQARRDQPINAEMPATAYDVQIVHKTKGFGDRREIQALPKESEKTALEWQGEDGFNQLVKVHGGRQQFYPIPPKTVCPNLQDRPADAKLSDKTANALRNVERNQWKTTYDLENTGLGPANPMKLDNLADKQNVYDTFGVTDDKLYPRAINTFDPPRPFEGRIARRIIPRPPPQKIEEDEEDTGYIRMKTLREREEHRLLNGTEYRNLPDTSQPDNRFSQLRWKEMNDEFHPDPNLEKVGGVQEKQPSVNIPYPPVVNKPPSTEENYLESTKQRQDDMFQQIEAQNRYGLLESEKPSHDITALNHKLKKVMEDEQPRTFYGHEGKFNEERAGLYKTSYSPERMAHSISDRETSGPEIMNTLHSHVDALNLPTKLSYEVNDALRFSKTLSTSTPNLAADKRDGREVLEPLQNLKNMQKTLLQPTVENARIKVQEGETILKESEMGSKFNTRKFLQEYDLPKYARSEPLNLMSIENQNLNNVRGAASLKYPGKSVTFNDNMTVASSREDGKFRIISAPTRGLGEEEENENCNERKPNTIQYKSTQAEWKRENENHSPTGKGRRRPQPTFLLPDQKPIIEERRHPSVQDELSPRRRTRRPATSLDATEYRDEFRSLSSNVAPSNLRHSYTFATAYENQFPAYHHIGYKEDPRFNWEPGCGKPRPQTNLLRIQDSFSKSASNRGTPFDKVPRIGGREVDLYLLYRRVISFGGWRKIVDESIWEQILRDFKVPKGCSNGTQALKFIYVRYLDVYEKIHFHGVDPKQPDDDEESEGPLRKKICLPQFGIPHSYNYEWHRIHASARAQLGMSTDLVKYSDHEKLEKSLLSGLPNEVDFVINVCTLLSNESRHSLTLEKSPNLLRLLMAHVGILENDKGSFETVYQDGWRAFTGRNYFNFWMETVQEKSIRQLISNNAKYKEKELVGSEVLHLGREQGLYDKEGQRVMQLAVIMRNLSFEEENMKFMTESDLVFRFLMLCIHSSYGCLRQLALDTLANISEKFDLCPDDNTQMLLQLLKTLTGSDDKYDVVRGLEMVSKLCLVDYNDTVLGENLEEKIIEDIVRLMNVFDIQIIVSSLEALYQLSELGEQTTTKIAAVRHAVDLLVTLLSIEAQSYGPNSLVGIKVVEYCPPPHLAGGADQSNSHHVGATPVTQALPPSQKTSQHHTPGTPSCDVETTTCSWLQSTYETKEGTSVSQVHMYAEYINFAKKFSLPQILPSQAFFNCVKMVYPDLQQYSMDKADGLTENGYKGICKRKVPLPITLSSTVGLNRHRASSVVYTPPNVMTTPNQSPLSTVDLTHTPTLRQRLMEPPKLSALQASPSLLPIGGAPVSKQQSAIYTSSKPATQTQTSASLKVQVSQADQLTPRKPLMRDNCGKLTSISAKNLHHHILKKQNMMKKTSSGAKMSPLSPGVSPKTGTSVQTLYTAPVDQPQSPGSSDTKNVKNLLAKKIRTQTPVPIAPKGSHVQPPQPPPPSIDTGGNPMHLLTFTTQQSTVIQGTLQQNLSPQPYVANTPPQVAVNPQQPYIAQNCVNSQQQFVSTTQTFIPSQQVHAGAAQSQHSAQNQVQIHGIQSVVDGVQQYVISQSDDGAFNSSCVNSSQSSHRSRSPKSDKSKKSSNSPNRSGSRSSRSSSPKGSSPKRQSSSSSQSSSPRSTSPKSYELEVCGEVERAKDVVKVGLEARIERVENRCLNQIKNMNKNISVIPMPSTSIPISSSAVIPSSQNIILPVIVGSTNTGQTGNFIPSNLTCPAATNPSNVIISNQQSVLVQQNTSQSAPNIMPVLPTTQAPSVQAQSLDSNAELASSVSSNIHSQSSQSEAPSSERSYGGQVMIKQDSLTPSEESVQEEKSLSESSTAHVENPTSPPKLKAKYVCSQDETEAAVSSLLINNDEETQQSISNGSDGDLGLSSAVVNAPDETEAAISAIAGFLENDHDEDDIDEPSEEMIMNEDAMNCAEEDQVSEVVEMDSNAEAFPPDVNMVENPAEQVSATDEKDITIGGHGGSADQTTSDMCTKQSEIILNGDLHSPESEIIPSPTSDDKCHINGIEKEDPLLEKDETGVLNKLAAEKLSKLNGITHRIGNGDFDKLNLPSEPQKLENGITEETVEKNSDIINESSVVPSGDTVRVNGCDDVEMHDEESEKFNGNIDNVMEIAIRNDDNEKARGGPCYELASEADAEDSGEVLIENEMCLQPTITTVSGPETASSTENASEATVEESAKSAMPEVLETVAKIEEKSEKVLQEEMVVNHTEKKVEDSEQTSEVLPDVSTGCVDILKAAIESEKIDELDLNGDSNDSLPVVTEGIYQTGLQMTVQNGHIPVGNEMTTTVGTNSINLIPNVFSTVQTGLVVGTIVSINNNILTTSNVPLPYVDTLNPPAKVTFNMEICPNNRHIPTPETSRDGELSCDSIASSFTDSSDKHSITIQQQPIISVQNVPNIHTSTFLSVQTTQPAKQQIITTTIIPTGPSQTSPRSTRSSERKPKKRNRNQSGSADSRCSSSTPPISQPAIQPTLPELMCEWIGCKKCFENTKSVFNHVYQTHIRPNNDGICRWEGCEKLQRKKWSLVTHIQDHHCSDAALRVAAIRRIQSQQSGVAATPTTVPALVYPPDAAWQAIRRFEPKPPYPEFNEQREGPVTKHIRLTAALVLRNLARYSSHGRSLIKKHERHINFMAMSALESSNALANCLWEVLHDH